MILAALTLTLALQSTTNGTTVVVSSRDETTETIQAVVLLPELRPTERLILATAARSAVQRTQEYGRSSVRAIASGGTAARIGSDHLRIGITFARADAPRALALLESILVRPSFLPEAMADDAAAASARPASPWDAALAPTVAPLATVLPEDALRLWSRQVRPETLTVSFGSSALAAEWERRNVAWPRPDTSPNYRIDRPEPEPERIGAARVVTLGGPVLPPGADLSPTLLALTALGAGKGSLGWRVLRLERAESYRVEGAMIGVVGGWRARLAFDLPPGGDAAAARAALAQGIEGLNEADLARAKGYLDAALRGEAYDDVLLPGGRRLTGSPADAAFLAAYLAAKRTAAPKVPWAATLDELKSACAEFLAKAESR